MLVLRNATGVTISNAANHETAGQDHLLKRSAKLMGTAVDCLGDFLLTLSVAGFVHQADCVRIEGTEHRSIKLVANEIGAKLLSEQT